MILTPTQQYGLDATTWKSFIPETTIPDKFRIPVKYHDQIERIDNLGPSDERHYRAAFNFRYLKVRCRFCQVTSYNF